MTRPKANSLSCGGKGPCCHIGYSHRHCEHCDVVIDTRPINWWYVPYQPLTVRPYPYQPYWGLGDGTYNNFGDVLQFQTAMNAAASSIDFLNTHQGNTGDFPKALPEHVCEAG